MDTHEMRQPAQLISIYPRAQAEYQSRTLTLEQVNDLIRSDVGVRRTAESIRAVREAGSYEDYREAKKSATAACYAGHNPVTRGRVMEDDGWIHSGFVLVECDPPSGSGVGPETIKDAAEGLPGLRQSATSMSGDGVHFVFEVTPAPASPGGHELAWYLLAKTLNERLSAAGAGAVKADTQTHDQARLSFLAPDPLARLDLGAAPAEWHHRRQEAADYRDWIEADREAKRAAEKAARGSAVSQRRNGRKAPVKAAQTPGNGGYSEHDIDLLAAEYLGCRGGLGPGGYNCWLGMITRLTVLGFTESEIAGICAIGGTHPDCGKVEVIREKMRGAPCGGDVETERGSLRGEAYNAGWRRPGVRNGGRSRGDGGAAGHADYTTAITDAMLSDVTRQYFAMIDGHMHVASPHIGDYILLDDHRYNHGVAAALLELNGITEIPGNKRLIEALISCRKVQDNPTAWGVKVIEPSSVNRVPLLPLTAGGMLDLRFARRITSEQAMALNSVRGENGYPVDYDPEEDLREPPAAARALLEHYPERFRRRWFYTSLRDIKTIDCYNILTPDWGKSTWVSLLKAAFPGIFDTVNTRHSTSTQGMKFSIIQRLLAGSRTVALDEGDKTGDNNLGPEHMNGLADDWVTVERKGRDAIIRRRQGNAVFIGNRWPNITPGLGSEARFRWAYQDDTALPLPEGIREWTETEAGIRWARAAFAVEIARVYAETYGAGQEFVDPIGEKTAREMLKECEQEDVRVLREVLRADKSGFTTNGEIEAVLTAAKLEPPKGKSLTKLVRQAFPTAKPERPMRDGIRESGFKGISL